MDDPRTQEGLNKNTFTATLDETRERERERERERGYEPEAGASVHQVEDLGRVEELLEAAEKLDALVIARLGVDEDEEGGAALRSHCLPCIVATWKNPIIGVIKSVNGAGLSRGTTANQDRVTLFIRLLLIRPRCCVMLSWDQV